MPDNSKLLSYSTLATSFLILQNIAEGQVVYTDIEPDTVLNIDEKRYHIDFKNDGIYDYEFQYETFSIYSTFYHVTDYFQRVVVGGYNPGNLIAGSYDVKYSPSATFTWYFPSALTLSDTINDHLLFQDFPFQLMGYWQYYFAFGFWTTEEGGNWYPEVEDKYLGVKFIDEDSCYHYGWIRCSVTDSGRVLTIKDYAYEEQCDNPILAGDTTHFTAITEIQNLDAVIYCFDKNVYVQINDFSKEAAIHIYDLTGKIVYTNWGPGLTNVISLDGYAAGVYVVEVVQGDKKMVKKVLVG